MVTHPESVLPEMTPKPTGSTVHDPADYFNRIAPLYADQINHEQRQSRRRGLELLDPRAGEQILEVGCGTGEDLITLCKTNAKVIGADAAPAMTELSQANLEEHQVAAQLITARAPKQLKIDAGSLDAVWTAFTLEFLSVAEMGETLRRIHRAMRAGGRLAMVSLALTWPDFGSVDTSATQWKDCFLDADHDPLLWKLFLEDFGFDVLRSEQTRLWGETVDIILASPHSEIRTIDVAGSIAGLGSPNAAERIRCRQRLCSLGHLAAGPLEESLQSDDEQWRAEAAKCLHWIGAPQSAPALARLLSDSSEKVRWIAGEALIKIADTKNIVSLLIRPETNPHLFYESASRVIRELRRRGRTDLAPLVDAFEADHPEVAVPVVAQRLHDQLPE